MATAEFSMKAGVEAVPYQFWDGQILRSRREIPLALDTETELITDARVIPTLALAVVSDGRDQLIIHPDRLGEFLFAHADAWFVGHNVQFDFWVIDQHLKQRREEPARRVLWNACDQGRLLDTQVLDQLLQLATGKFRHAPDTKNEDTKIYPGNLADVAADYTSVRINKDDPYRKRFHELIGLTMTQWSGVDPGFFHYAAADARATWRLYPALAEVARELMDAAGFDRKAKRYDIHPYALEKFGHLSEIIQVQASIALAYMYRRGVRVDQAKVKELEAKYRADLEAMVAELERDYRDVLTYKKDGTLKRTKNQTPSMAYQKLDPMLERVAAEIQPGGHSFQLPARSGKTQGVSRKAGDWAPYETLHPFIGLWARLKKQAKLIEFVAKLSAEILHGDYALLMRTGRTSCSKPRDTTIPGVNIQQMPKAAEFRELFIPDHDHKLFIGDYAAAELRTLATVCVGKYGDSKLGEVIKKGLDPHSFTAAAILGMSLDDFLQLKQTDPGRYKEARQRSKPINFGVPGGMGAKRLMASAKSTYGVILTEEEAKRFREKLINDVYPEQNAQTGYLADPTMGALAHNLGVHEREAWEVLDHRGQHSPIAVMGISKVVRGASTASEYYQNKVWDGLARLLNTVTDPDPELADLIGRRQGCAKLHERLSRQTVATLTGRLRGGVGYTEGKNTPFQSLCSDGGKLAMWKLLHAGFDVYAFVHDEILVQLPAVDVDAKAAEVEKIMVASMEAVMGHGIPAAVDKIVANCWRKP